MERNRLNYFISKGYKKIGITEYDETLVARKFVDDRVLLMAVHEKYVTQISLTPDAIKELNALVNP